MPKIYYSTDGMPVYRPQDGWKNQDEWSNAVLNDLTVKPKKEEQKGSTLGKFASTVLPGAGAMVGEALDPLGGGIPGAVAGTAIKSALRSKFPETFGSNPETTLGQVGDAASDIGLQGVAPGLARGVMSGLSPAMKMAAQLLPNKLGKAASMAASAIPEVGPKMQQSVINVLRSLGLAAKDTEGSK